MDTFKMPKLNFKGIMLLHHLDITPASGQVLLHLPLEVRGSHPRRVCGRILDRGQRHPQLDAGLRRLRRRRSQQGPGIPHLHRKTPDRLPDDSIFPI